MTEKDEKITLLKDIKVDLNVYKQLIDIKMSNSFRNMNEVIRYLLTKANNNTVSNCLDLGKFNETRASLNAWAKILIKYMLSNKILIEVEEGIYALNLKS